MKRGLLKQIWWKYTGAALTLAIILAGLLIPIRPGIVDVSTNSITPGESSTFDIIGYNTMWSEGNAEDIRVWLKMDDKYAILNSDAEVINNTRLRVTFDIPPYLPYKRDAALLTVVVDHPTDGVTLLPDRMSYRSEAPEKVEIAAWQQPIEQLNFRKKLSYPYRNLLTETIRNQYFHVPLWFAMFNLFLFSVVKSVHNLKSFSPDRDRHIVALNQVGILFGILGLTTGMLWAQYTWNKFWSWDIKQTMTLIALLIYLAYFVLRGSIEDFVQKTRVSNVFNVFAFVMMIALLFVVPRLSQNSLHPGSGGNPAFGGDDLDNTMKLIFYPSIIAWSLMGFWIASIKARYLGVLDIFKRRKLNLISQQ